MRGVSQIGYWVVLVLLTIVAGLQSQTKSSTEGVVLPSTLDSLYPPQAPAPVYLLNMIQLATPLSGLTSDLMQGDLENAGKTVDKFRNQYAIVAQMVPEWKNDFPMKPVDDLQAAMSSKDPSKVMPAIDKVGQVCNDCHIRSMAAAQQRYHWGNFNDIAATDPISNQSVSFSVLMKMVDGSLSGIETDLDQGQIGNAQANVKALKARFGELIEVCQACHDSERKYFVDETITSKIDELQKVLGASPADHGKALDLIQGIGMESCHKCHLVHVPAAYSKYRFGQTEASQSKQ